MPSTHTPPPPPELIIADARHVRCDGGGGALGHPVVYYDMGDADFVECGYCDRRFVLRGSPSDPSAERDDTPSQETAG